MIFTLRKSMVKSVTRIGIFPQTVDHGLVHKIRRQAINPY